MKNKELEMNIVLETCVLRHIWVEMAKELCKVICKGR